MEAVLVDTSNRYWDYPKPIAVSDPVLSLMQDEFNRSDSLSLLFVEQSYLHNAEQFSIACRQGLQRGKQNGYLRQYLNRFAD